MAIGRSITKADLDNWLGNVAYEIEQAFGRVPEIKRILDNLSDAVLLAAPYSYTQAEIDAARAALADLVELGQIRAGNRTLPAAKDFRTNTRKLHGPVF